MTLGDRIKFYRQDLGLTQYQLAQLTGIHPISIRNYETNKKQPQPIQLEKIATTLGVSSHALNGIEHTGMRFHQYLNFQPMYTK